MVSVKRFREEMREFLLKIESPSNLFLVYASLWFFGVISFWIAMGTSRWVRHQLVRGIIGDYHGLFISCAARDITKRTDGCSAPEWSVEKVPLYILVTRWLMICSACFNILGTLGTFGLRSAFYAPPIPRPHFLARISGVLIIIGGLLNIIACIVFSVLANSSRDGIFVRGADGFFRNSVVILEDENRFFNIPNFFEPYKQKSTRQIFTFSFADSFQRPGVVQQYYFSYYFAWFAGLFHIAAGITAVMLALRLQITDDRVLEITAHEDFLEKFKLYLV